jgi:hypothetical protein
MVSAELCDHTGCRRTANVYTLTSRGIEGGRVRVALCDQHDRPVRLLEEIARKADTRQGADEKRRKTGVSLLQSRLER